MAITHKFVSGVADSTDTTLVRSSNWNADHNFPPFVVPFHGTSAATQAWTNMPAALTEFAGLTRYRISYDLTYVSQARLWCIITVAGTTNAELRVQYSTNNGTDWFYLDGVSGPAVVFGATTNAPRVGAWVTLEAAARADVWLRLVGINGDGAADPAFAQISLHVR